MRWPARYIAGMYEQAFGLLHDPFSIAPDPRFLFMSGQHREALAHLMYGLTGGGGFVLLTGEIGSGKTTLCRCALQQLPPHCDVAYIYNPRLTTAELLQTVCEEFRLEPPGTGVASRGVKPWVDAINTYLLAQHAAGRHSVLVIDEAQNLSPKVLEQLRLLTNLETNERKLLQIILVGQPDLRDLVARPELDQLSQRVIARYHLGPLNQAETVDYVTQRLRVAGLRGAVPFTPRALRWVHRSARGVPRRINLVCGRALLGAYAKGVSVADHRLVAAAAQEVLGHRPGLQLALPAWLRWGRG